MTCLLPLLKSRDLRFSTDLHVMSIEIPCTCTEALKNCKNQPTDESTAEECGDNPGHFVETVQFTVSQHPFSWPRAWHLWLVSLSLSSLPFLSLSASREFSPLPEHSLWSSWHLWGDSVKFWCLHGAPVGVTGTYGAIGRWLETGMHATTLWKTGAQAWG